eukprot:1193316-Prorocentrum_minimum.AAC.2
MSPYHLYRIPYRHLEPLGLEPVLGPRGALGELARELEALGDAEQRHHRARAAAQPVVHRG